MAQQRRQREETSFESEVGVPASAARVGSTTPQAFTCTMGRSRHNFITTEASLSVRGCSSWVPNSIRGNDNVRGGNARGGSGKEIQEPNDRAKPSRVDERSDGRGHLVSVQPRRNEGEILEDEETGRRVGPDARARESKAAMTIEDAVARAQSKSWVKATANRFVIKFHATSTWLSKRSKRRKIGQLLNVIGLEGPPVSEEALTQVSALLDHSNTQSADQYVAEQVVACGGRLPVDRGAGKKARPVREEGHRTREKSSGGEAGRTGRLAMGCGKDETLRTYESGMVLCVGRRCGSSSRSRRWTSRLREHGEHCNAAGKDIATFCVRGT